MNGIWIRKGIALVLAVYSMMMSITPNDPRISEEYYHQKMNNFRAWTIHTDTPAYVFHFSTGIAYHPDLEQNVRRDLAIDTTVENGDAIDREGSGTGSAGLIAGVGDNGIGGAGVAWHVNLVPVKVLSDTGKGTITDFINGMSKALDMVEARHLHAVFYIGLSFSVDYASAFAQFKRAKKDGVLVVTRAGDSGVDINDYTSFPANYAVMLDNILVAASTDATDALAPFSNRGIGRVVALPGVDLDTTYLDNGYAATNGTGASAALLAGAAALLMQNDDMDYRTVIARIKQTAHPVPGAGAMAIGIVDTYAMFQSTAHFISQPIARFQADTIEGVAGEPVKLNMSLSEAAKGAKLTYRIVDFGERLPQPTPPQDSSKFEHIFPSRGFFTVKGVVNDGTQDSIPAKIKVVVRPFANRAPVVKVHNPVIVTHLDENTVIKWKGFDNEHDPLTYNIKIVPGNVYVTTADHHTTHVFSGLEQLGDYAVTIIASDGLQESDPATAIIEVQDDVNILEATFDPVTNHLYVAATTNAQPLPTTKLSVKDVGLMETKTIVYQGKEVIAQVFDAVVDAKPGKTITVLSTYGGSATHRVN